MATVKVSRLLDRLEQCDLLLGSQALEPSASPKRSRSEDEECDDKRYRDDAANRQSDRNGHDASDLARRWPCRSSARCLPLL
jgi:hypothetical protein